jgi:hypothetical protein
MSAIAIRIAVGAGRPVDVGVEAGQVGDEADLDHVAGNLGLGRDG